MSKQWTGRLGINARVELEMLEKEHAHIHCRLAELDEVILQAPGSPRIIEAARELAGLLLLHIAHETELLNTVPLAALGEQRRAGKKLMDEVLSIEAALSVEGAYAALRLRALCKRWISDHMYMERVEFEIAAALGNEMQAQVARPAL